MSVNLDGRTNGLFQITEVINKFNPKIICIQDPPIYQSNVESNIRETILNNYSIGAGGDSIEHRFKHLILNRRDTETIAHHFDQEVYSSKASATGVTLRTNKSNRPSIIIGVYIRPRATPQETIKCLEWIEYTIRKDAGISNSIILGDFNAINLAWAPTNEITNNQETSELHYRRIRENRGRIIRNFIDRLKLTCLNPYTNLNIVNYIDLALIGNKMIRKWREMEVVNLNERNHSHKIIILKSHQTSNNDNIKLLRDVALTKDLGPLLI